jgi:cob(I)alamin adenosyltransferase
MILMPHKIAKGLVQVYTGNGKGKTTAALGLALRAVGKGLNVYMIQFMKGDIEYGEITAAKKMENFEIIQMGRPDFVDKNNPADIDIELANEALEHATVILASEKYDIVILDEINVAMDWKLIEVDKVIELIKIKPEHIELVLTGRYAPQVIIDIADLVTEMIEIKHPYNDGIEARDGIEH